MVIVRGVNVYPTAVEEIVRGFAEIAEYQAQVDSSASLAELTLADRAAGRLRRPGGAGAARARRVAGGFQLRVPVALAPGGSLPRFEMKARRWKV